MNYDFPTNLTLEDVQTAIDAVNKTLQSPCFSIYNKGDYIVSSYNFVCDESFPSPTTGDPELDRNYAILRECRGLIFDPNGKLVGRRYHKFFNLNEKSETKSDTIDFTKPHIVLEKIDGSMVSPLYLDTGIVWSTKRGISDVSNQASKFVEKHPIYDEFVAELQKQGAMPIFEWCSPFNRIVLAYGEDKLVLTAVRELESGKYWSYDDMQTLISRYPSIPLIKAVSHRVTDINKLINVIKTARDEEGIVIRFDDGHMIKMKSEWYCELSSSYDIINNEKNIVRLIVHGNMDDARPLFVDGVRQKVEAFETDFYAEIGKSVKRVRDAVQVAKERHPGDRKSVAAMPELKELRKINNLLGGMFWCEYDGGNIIDLAFWKIGQQNNSTHIDNMRSVFGNINWEDYK